MPLPNRGEPPAKKPRFFASQNQQTATSKNNSSTSSSSSGTALSYPKSSTKVIEADSNPTKVESTNTPSFDPDLVKALCGSELSDLDISYLERISGGNIERAVNLYYDGAIKNRKKLVENVDKSASSSGSSTPIQYVPRGHSSRDALKPNVGQLNSQKDALPKNGSLTVKSEREVASAKQFQNGSGMPHRRYVGAFGAAGWAMCTGPALKTGTKVLIERDRRRQLTTKSVKGKVRSYISQKTDSIVRFTTVSGQEIGRLESDTSQWLAPLIDQGICEFEGSCVYSPSWLRSGETIFLQLKCFILTSAFMSNQITKMEADDVPHFFEAKESTAERDLRLRQMSLVKLFDEIGLFSTRSEQAANEKIKRQNFLKAVSDKPEAASSSSSPAPSTPKTGEDGDSEAEEGEQLEQNQLDDLYKKAQSFDFDTPEYDPPDTFALSLRKYQKQALYWMITKEQNQKAEHKADSMHPLWEEYAWPTRDVVEEVDLPDYGKSHFYLNPYSGEISLEFPKQEQNCLGGILADEMGLGKTIEMLALVHSNRGQKPTSTSSPTFKDLGDLSKMARVFPAVVNAPRTTLVVGPMSLLAQWQSEAEKASHEDTLRTKIYYGNEKVNLQSLCCSDNWNNAPDVVITTYGVVLSEYTQLGADATDSARGMHGGLFSLDYHRVILDEAHYIKNRISKTAKACYSLRAKHRWVLTGTPIVNRLEDLFSLVRFLQVEPWSNFSYWKTFITLPFESKNFIRALDVVQSVMEPLVLRRTKEMKTPDGEVLVPLPPRTLEVCRIELSKQEQEVYDFIYVKLKQAFNENVEAGTLLKSYTTIFAQVLRLRQVCCHPILTRTQPIVEDEGAPEAPTGAPKMEDDMDLNALIDRFTDSGDQDVNRFGAHALRQIQDAARMECPICTEDPMVEQTVAACWHGACKKCLLEYMNFQKNRDIIPLCMTCRQPMHERDLFQVIRHDESNVPLPISTGPSSPTPSSASTDEFPGSQAARAQESGRISLRRVTSLSSAKVTALLERLNQLRRDHNRYIASGRKAGTSVGSKVIVFSQFTSFLDIIQTALSRDKIQCLRFDGRMNQAQRAATLTEFRNRREDEPNSMIVLLVSLRAGGVGLNLTCARHVFMMDPWWSFAVESQAIDRVHRMGQEHPVSVTRFIIRGSIEEKMLKIQEKKKFLASSLGMMDDEEKRLARIEDIKDLLS